MTKYTKALRFNSLTIITRVLMIINKLWCLLLVNILNSTIIGLIHSALFETSNCKKKKTIKCHMKLRKYWKFQKYSQRQWSWTYLPWSIVQVTGWYRIDTFLSKKTNGGNHETIVRFSINNIKLRSIKH